jgi:transposase
MKVADASLIELPLSTPTRSPAHSTGAKETSAMRSVALDLGARETSFCEVREGRVVLRRTVQSLEGLEDVLGPSTPPARVAIEACREAWFVHDRLRAWGHDVLVVDTTRARQLGIGQHGRKTDRLDAEHLARAVERGGIPLAHVLSPSRRVLREQLNVRRALVEARAQYITTVRGILRARGTRLARPQAEDFVATIRRATLDVETQRMIEPLVQTLDGLTVQIARVDLELEALCAQEPVLLRLTTAPGVGLIVAAAYVSVLDEAGRFRDAHQVASYLGLVPREDTSGGRAGRRLGAITKQGNGYLRALLTQAAHTVMRGLPDDPLRRWADSIAKRRGKRIAVIALARRLAGVLWAMWRHGTVYEAALVGAASARGLARQAQSLDAQAAGMKRAAQKAAIRQRDARRHARAASPGAASAPRRRAMA